MDFIFMLTQNDRTIENCLDVLDAVRFTGLKHIGCKEVGASEANLRELLRQIRAMRATSYLELVGTTVEECAAGARWAIELGFDRVMGGKDPQIIAEICRGKVEYYPFPGRPEGHPTRLFGTPADIASDCERLASLGCPGVDLLAYRAVDADPEALIAAARAAFGGQLVVAGSIDSLQRIARIAALGVDGFTIGSAILDASLLPEEPTLQARIQRVLLAAEGEADRASMAWLDA